MKQTALWKEKKNYHILYQIGILMLPIIEIYRSFWGDTVQIAGLALEEVVIILWAGLLFLAGCAFSFVEKRNKALLWIGGYLLVFFVYMVLHGINASRFQPDLLPGASPSFVVECYYLFRMYLVPLCLLFAAFLLRLPFDSLRRALKGAVWIIAFFVVIPDLFGFSFASYHDGNVRVDGGFFAWFSLTEQSNFAMYTAKGLFSSANDMASILFAATPLIALDALQRRKWQDVLLLFLAGLSSIMIGTKIASLGFFLSVLGMVIAFLFEIVLKKRPRTDWRALLLPLAIFALCIPLFLVSPGYRLQTVREREAESDHRPIEAPEEVEDLTQNSDLMDEEEIFQLEKYMEKHHWDHFVDPWFLELYPVRYDPEFWQEVIRRPNHLNSDSRDFKIFMADWITQRNGNEADVLFGIGYTAGLPYAERDYLFQYYLFGIVGLFVLLAPILFLFGENLWKLILRLFRKGSLLPAGSALLSVFAFLVTAYLAGHVLDTILCMYFLAFSSACYLTQRDE